MRRVEIDDQLKRVEVSQNGKTAITHFQLIKQYPDFAYVSAEIDTGRTHQIRVHAAHIGYPIIGDGRYGKAKNPYMDTIFLHADTLRFYWRGEHKVLTCEVSTEWKKCLEDLN